MKCCSKCGVEIINGENGCALMDICFDCNGGYPKYAPATKRGLLGNDDYFDYVEGCCIGDIDD